MQRRDILRLGCGALGVASAGIRPVLAQTSGAPIKIVYPFSAGGSGDATARIVAEAIGVALGRPAIVENKTGADGRIGIQSVKAAAATGDTLVITTGPAMWLMHMVHANPGFDPLADFEPVSLITKYEFCIAVANNTGLTTFKDLIAWIKANPDKAAYGIPAIGTMPHFIGVSLAKTAGLELRRVVYRGGVPQINDLVGGQIPIAIATIYDALQHHRAGTVRILAATGETRSTFLPDVPTLKENGIDLHADAWHGLWAPKGTPRDVVAKLNAIVIATMHRPDVRQRLDDLGLVAVGTSPEQLTAAMKDNAVRWGPVIRESGYRIEQ